MKSEHRHQLETNDLAARLAKSIEGLKPYSGQIITGLVALLLVYAGLTVWDARVAEREKAAWEAYALATDTADPELKSLQAVASNEEYDGTVMQEWAYVGWADRQVLIAMQNALYDRAKMEDILRGVTGIYEQLGRNASDPQVLNRARFGLGRVYELQNNLDKARSQYLTVRGDLQPKAAERAEQLESEEVGEAISWLATAELPKRDLTGGQGATGQRPNFEADLPSTQSTTDGISAETFKSLLGDALEDSPVDEDRYGESDDTTAEDDESATEAAETSEAAEEDASSQE